MQIHYVEAFFLDGLMNELNIVADVADIGKYDLYWTYELDPYTSNKNYLLTSDKKNLTFECPYNAKKRTYFIIEIAGQSPLLFGHRILPIPGMFNFRDIGGYRTQSGKRIKWGVGYRSDHLCNMDAEGFEYMRNLQLRTIVDYRSDREIKENPNPDISPDINSYCLDPQAHTAVVAGSAQNLDTSKYLMDRAEQAVAKGEKGSQQMIEQQLQFVSSSKSKQAFSQMLKILSDPTRNPSVQHCRGGKDRTGFALMLLEGLLGVPEDLLVYDYMLTHRAREKKNALYYQRFLEMTQDKKIADYLYSLYDTKPEFIEASIAKIIEEYGSIADYAKKELDISETDIQNLKEVFLEG